MAYLMLCVYVCAQQKINSEYCAKNSERHWKFLVTVTKMSIQ